MLGRGAAPALAKFDSLTALARLEPAQLLDAGFSPAQAEKLQAVLAICLDYSAEQIAPGTVICDTTQIGRIFMPRLRHLQVEQVWVVLLDPTNAIIAERMVAQGTSRNAPCDPREVLGTALRCGADGMIVVHNHVGADPTPSPDDYAATMLLSGAANHVGLRFIDHVVVAANEFYSFVDHNWRPPKQNKKAR